MKKVILTLVIGMMTIVGFGQVVTIDIDTVGYFNLPLNENPQTAEKNNTFNFLGIELMEEKIVYDLYNMEIVDTQIIEKADTIINKFDITSFTITDEDLSLTWVSKDRNHNGKTFISFQQNNNDGLVISWYMLDNKNQGWFTKNLKTEVKL